MFSLKLFVLFSIVCFGISKADDDFNKRMDKIQEDGNREVIIKNTL